MEQSAPESSNAANLPGVSPVESMGLLIKEMRPKQWVKNLIIYAPLLFVGHFSDPSGLLAAATRGVALSCVRSQD